MDQRKEHLKIRMKKYREDHKEHIKELDKKYKVVKDMFMDEQFPSRYFTDKDLVSHIIKLNEKVEKLSAKLYRYKRIKDIIELVDKRTPEGHEWTVEKKLIAMYNGLK